MSEQIDVSTGDATWVGPPAPADTPLPKAFDSAVNATDQPSGNEFDDIVKQMPHPAEPDYTNGGGDPYNTQTANPFDEVVKEQKRAIEAESAAHLYRVNTQATPEQLTESFRLSQQIDRSPDVIDIGDRMGLPYDVVARNLDKLRPPPVDMQSLTDFSPKLAKWFTNPQNFASIPQEDYTKLSGVEAISNYFAASYRMTKNQYAADMLARKISDAYDNGEDIAPMIFQYNKLVQQITPEDQRLVNYTQDWLDVPGHLTRMIGGGIQQGSNLMYYLRPLPSAAKVGIGAGLAAAVLSAETGPGAIAIGQEVGSKAFSLAYSMGLQYEYSKQPQAQAFIEYLSAGVDPKLAKIASNMTGAVEGMIEMGMGIQPLIGVGWTKKSLKAALHSPSMMNVFMRYARTSAASAIEEGTEEPLQGFSRVFFNPKTWEGAFDPNRPLAESFDKVFAQFFGDASTSAIHSDKPMWDKTSDVVTTIWSSPNVESWRKQFAGAAWGSALQGLFGAAPEAISDIQSVREHADVARATIDMLSGTQTAMENKVALEQMANLSTETTDTGKAQAPLTEMVNEHPDVYVPVEMWNKMFQDVEGGPRAAAEQILTYTGAGLPVPIQSSSDPGSSVVTGGQQYDSAVASGADIKVPTETYIKHLANSKFNAELLNEIRLSPDAMNAREATEFASTVKSAVEGDDAAVKDLTERLRGVGFNAQTADDYAQQMAAALTTMGTRSGLASGEELLAKYGLNITREGMAPNGAILGQPTQTLSADMAAIEEKFSKQLGSDFNASVAQYNALADSEGGKILSTDVARELSADYNANRGLSMAVHEPASAFIKALYARKLQELPKGSDVLFTAGGTGAGKTTALAKSGVVQNVGIVYDGNLSTMGSTLDKIDMALAAGHHVKIALVLRDPVQAFRHGVLKRLQSQAEKHGTGRVVPAIEHVRTHLGAIDVVKQIAQKYANNPNVEFVTVNNTGKIEDVTVSKGVEAVNKTAYDVNAVVGGVNAQLEEAVKAVKAGEISQQTAEAIGKLGPGVGRQLEEELAQGRSQQAERLNQGPAVRTAQIDSTIKTLGRKIGKRDMSRSLVNDLYGNGVTQKFKTQRQLGDFLDARAGGELEETDENVGRLANLLAFEALHAVRTDSNAATWYRDRVAAAMRVASLMHPELETDPFASFVFSAAIAITSNGSTVAQNVSMANSVYESFRKTGEMPVDVSGAGKAQASIRQSMVLFNSLRKEMGDQGLMNFFAKEYRVGELNEIGKRYGFKISGEGVNEMLYGSAVLGPKVGQGFFQNLRSNFKPLTIDRWVMRTWGRLKGRITPNVKAELHAQRLAAFREASGMADAPEADVMQRAREMFKQYARDGFKDRSVVNRAAKVLVENETALIEAPTTGKQRQYIRKVVGQAVDIVRNAGLNVDNADLQALIWYPEKDLFKAYGVSNERATPTDYATELAAFATKQGFDEGTVQARLRGDGLGGLSTAGQAEVLNQPAYHGSPHTFDEFKLQHIGSGEGAAAYGWGLYFSSKKEVAQWYRDSLSRDNGVVTATLPDGSSYNASASKMREYSKLIDGLSSLAQKELKVSPADGRAMAQGIAVELPRARDQKSFLKYFVDNVKYWQDKLSEDRPEVAAARLADAKESLSLAKLVKVDVAKKGHVYTVDIPEQSDMLDWDKQWKSQSRRVRLSIQQALLNAVNDGHIGTNNFEDYDIGEVPGFTGSAQLRARLQKWERRMLNARATGEEVYAEIGTLLRTNEEGTSRFLSDAGIPGLTYKGDSSGERNYVVFDDSQVKIQTMEQQNRGYIAISPTRQLSIGLLENADLSTFIHESGHAYLEVFNDLVKQVSTIEDKTDLQKQMLDDADTLAKWMGIKSLDEMTVEHKEQFARGYEAYAMEGNAPTIGLRRAFARFRTWMLALYKSITSLNVKLNDDVRAVFDRMLATDDAIDAAKKDLEDVPLFNDAISAGMSDREFAAYRTKVEDANRVSRETLERKLMREMMRERETWWKEQSAEIRDAVVAELNSNRDYNARSVLRNGTTPDGTAVETPIKLDRKTLRAIYGSTVEGKTVLARLRGMMSDEGVLPDQAAHLLGFASADDLIDSLTSGNLKPYAQVVADTVQARMLAKYGDMRTDGSLADAAKSAVASNYRETVIQAELQAIAALQRAAAPTLQALGANAREAQRQGASLLRSIPDLNVFRRIAAGRIAQSAVRDILPGQWLQAARKASRNAQAALLKQDYATAGVEKQRELFGLEMYRQSIQARDQNQANVEYLRKFSDKGTRGRIGKAGGNYLEQIDALLEGVDLAPTALRELARRQSLQNWVADRVARGQPVDEDLMAYAQTIVGRSYKNISTDELQGLTDSVRHIEHLSRLKNRLLATAQRADFEATMQSLLGAIAKNHPKTIPAEVSTTRPQDRIAHGVGMFFAAHAKVAELARTMDGNQDNGTVWETLILPRNVAQDAETERRSAATQTLIPLFKPLMGIGNRAAARAAKMTAGMFEAGIYQPHFEASINTRISRVEKLMIALNWGNNEGRQRVLSGESTYAKDRGTGANWSESSVRDLLSTLTAEDWAFVDGVHNFIDTFWPEIKALSERLDGIAPSKIEAAPFQTNDGVTHPGGYFPIHYDSARSARAQRHADMQAAQQMMVGQTIRATTKHGFRMSREAQILGRPLMLDLSVIFSHVNNVIHDITHTEMLVDQLRLQNDSRFVNSVRARYGDNILQQFRTHLVDMATSGRSDGGVWGSQIASFLRAGATYSAFTLNFTVPLMQPLGLFISMERVGSKWIAKGMSKWLRNDTSFESARDWIYANSTYMKNRHTTLMREVNDISNRLQGETDFSPYAFMLISKAQMLADTPTWLGAYEKAMEEGVTEERAFRLADQAVKDSQGGGELVDLARIQRGNPWMKLFTVFYHYSSMLLNRNIGAVTTLQQNFKGAPVHAVAEFAVDMALLNLIPGIAVMVGLDMLKGGRYDDWQEFLKRLFANLTGNFLNQFIIARELQSAFSGYDYQGTAGERGIAVVSKLIKGLTQGKFDWHAANETAGMMLHGYPSTEIQRLIDGTQALQSGDSNNPLILLTGPPPKALRD